MKHDLLIVDDDVAVCEGLKVVLELEDFEVLTSGDAALAVRQVRDLSPALVVIDCNMPGMSGIQATELIRAVPSDVPIIGISAETRREEEMRKAGVSVFLPKPLDMARLTEIIGALLAARSAS